MFRKLSVVLTALLIALALAGRAQADATPTPDQMMEMLDDTSDENDHGDRIPANGASVKIVAPEHNTVLDRDNVIVRVETIDWPLGEEGHHWHLYVNGKEQGMSQGNAPALQARDLQPGENVIEVTLSNEMHQELDATAQVIVYFGTTDHTADTATTETAMSTTAAAGLSAGVLLTLVLVVAAVAAILGIGFAVTRKKA